MTNLLNHLRERLFKYNALMKEYDFRIYSNDDLLEIAYNNPIPNFRNLALDIHDRSIKIHLKSGKFNVTKSSGEKVSYENYSECLDALIPMIKKIPLERKKVMKNWLRDNKRSLIAVINRYLERNEDAQDPLTLAEAKWLYKQEKKFRLY